MNWEAIGAIGEIVGAIAVVASLAYLAAQIRHNSSQVAEQIRSLELQAYDASATHFSGFRLAIASNPQLAALWSRGKENFKELSREEKAQLNELITELFWAYENMLLRKTKGAIDDALWELVEENIRQWLVNKGIRQWWVAGLRPPHSPAFTAIVDRVYEEYLQGDA